MVGQAQPVVVRDESGRGCDLRCCPFRRSAGGKLTGAGGGGFLLLFATPDLHAAIRNKLGGILCVPFRFETHGSQIIFDDPAEDYSDAEKDRANRTIRAFYEWKTGVPA